MNTFRETCASTGEVAASADVPEEVVPWLGVARIREGTGLCALSVSRSGHRSKVASRSNWKHC